MSHWRSRIPNRIAVLGDADREADRLRVMTDAPDGPVWVFAYGSLMWHPCFKAAESRRGALAGYRREFNFWTMVARGTKTNPGLGLGLAQNENSVCTGVVYRLDSRRVEEDTRALWTREMYSGVYRPTWVSVDAEEGAVKAITFVADPTHVQYAGGLTMDEQAEIIASASGKYGPCHEYLTLTIRHLADIGIREPAFDELARRVQVHLAGATPRSES